MPIKWAPPPPKDGSTVTATLTKIDGLDEPYVLRESPCLRFSFAMAGEYEGLFASKIVGEMLRPGGVTRRFLEGMIGTIEEGEDVMARLRECVGEPFRVTVLHREGDEGVVFLNVKDATPTTWP